MDRLAELDGQRRGHRLQDLPRRAQIATVQATYFTDSGLVAASTHTHQVRAVDAAGNQSAASPTLSARAASQQGHKRHVECVVFDRTGTLLENPVARLTLSTGAVG